jgi:hypothetical protein
MENIINTISDERLMENIKFSHSEEDINIYEFNHISNPNETLKGVIAQHMLETPHFEAVTLNEETGYYEVDYSKLPIKL